MNYRPVEDLRSRTIWRSAWDMPDQMSKSADGASRWRFESQFSLPLWLLANNIVEPSWSCQNMSAILHEFDGVYPTQISLCFCSAGPHLVLPECCFSKHSTALAETSECIDVEMLQKNRRR